MCMSNSMNNCTIVQSFVTMLCLTNTYCISYQELMVQHNAEGWRTKGDVFKIYFRITIPTFLQKHQSVRMAEWSKALRSGRSPLLRAWVRIPLLTSHPFFLFFLFSRSGYIVFFSSATTKFIYSMNNYPL